MDCWLRVNQRDTGAYTRTILFYCYFYIGRYTHSTTSMNSICCPYSVMLHFAGMTSESMQFHVGMSNGVQAASVECVCLYFGATFIGTFIGTLKGNFYRRFYWYIKRQTLRQVPHWPKFVLIKGRVPHPVGQAKTGHINSVKSDAPNLSSSERLISASNLKLYRDLQTRGHSRSC